MVYKHKISLAYNIYSPHNVAPFSTNLVKADSGSIIKFSNTASNTTAQTRLKQTMAPRLPDISTMTSIYVTILSLTGLYNEARKIHILPAMKIAPLISLGALYYDSCTFTLDKTFMKVQKHGQQILRGYSNHHTGMWEVTKSNTPHKDLTTSIV